MPWRAILFDLDGTLADTVELILRCYRHTMRTHLGEELPDACWLARLGTPLRDQLREFARDDDEAARMLETYVTFQNALHDESVRPYPNVVEVIEKLGADGTALAVVTSKHRRIAQRTVDRCGLGDRFELLVGADDVTHGKPDPEPVLLALERLGIEGRAGEVLFVGDSPYDMRAGRAAGTYTAAALWGPYGREVLEAEAPDFWLQSFTDLLYLRPGSETSRPG
jgi:pyrophosphatase PpaX